VCGIAGIYAYHNKSPAVEKNELIRIRDFMTSRGPDNAGIWMSGNQRVGLAHRRLSIIDPSPSGHQPMTRGTATITYNGEIYNFRSLRETLKQQGHMFNTESDTEVLLALYQQHGVEMAGYLCGMYALAIWDAQKEKLILVRDPYGIKPLYFCNDNGQFRFASQVKALIAGGKVSKEKDPAAEAAYLMLGSVPEPATIFSSISVLPAGCTLVLDSSGIQYLHQFDSIAETWDNALQHQSEPDSLRITAGFRDSVARHLVSDVPVGVFLSAGIDSGAIAGLMSEVAHRNIQSITLQFGEYAGSENDESVLASEVAALYGISHTSREVSEHEFRGDLTPFLDAMDQPTIDGLNTWFISKAAAETGIKVMLSGLGGDELMGSYPSFRRIPKWNRSMKWTNKFTWPGSVAEKLRKFIPYGLFPPKMWGLARFGGTRAGAYFLNRGVFMPWDLPDLMDHDRLEAGLKNLDLLAHIESCIPASSVGDVNKSGSRTADSQAAISSMESCLYMRNQLLRDTDWASMAHSIEVRTPLVDFQLLKDLAPRLLSVENLDSKLCLANSPAKPLPEGITRRSKTGFTTPIGSWIESSRRLDHWRSVPALSHASTHWSRKYAFSVLKEYCAGV
jgi:asparagine synthase (glutamine-hydrolysing)